VADVREHVAAAVIAAGRDDEATVRTVLDRLGAPEEIVAAATNETTAVPPSNVAPGLEAAQSTSWSWREIVAALLLVPGAFVLPVIGPLAGIAVAWSSAIWDKRTKRYAAIVGSVGAAIPLFFIALGLGLFLPFSSTISSGGVTVAQSPTVISEVATPASSIPVPNVVGARAVAGTNRLLAAGFMVVTSYVHSGQLAPGFITSMSPPPGSQAPAGSQVSIVVAR
jgi:hypothetical protein